MFEDGSSSPKGGEHYRFQGRGTKLIENAGEKVGRNPGRSVGKLASAAGLSCGAMQNVLRGGLACPFARKQKVSCCAGCKGL